MNCRTNAMPLLPTLDSLQIGYQPTFEYQIMRNISYEQNSVQNVQVENTGKFEFTFDFSSDDSCDFSDDTFISCSYDY